MLYIDDDGNIKLTRGDTAPLDLEVEDADGNPYDYSNDTVVLTIKKNTVIEAIVLQKTFNGGSIKLLPSDTEPLPYAKYRYDIQLTTSDGDNYTVIDPRNFELTEEVNFDVPT